MTALQILEKLGANSSFDKKNLSDEENKSIDLVVSKTQHFNAAQTHQFPDPDEKEEDNNDDEEKEEIKA